MHLAHPPTLLPSSEYLRLQRLMLTMIGSRTAFASVLRRKLGAAVPRPPSPLLPDRAVSGALVRFRINGLPSQERMLTWQPPKRGDAVNLSLLSCRGLALLGLSRGDSVSYRTERNRTEFLEVEDVSHPDRTKAAAFAFMASDGAAAGAYDA